jgi:pyridoxamine 5'-phosphate oxidase family protein
MFTQAERDYITGQRLVRLATATPSGRPHVVPLAFRLEGDKVLLFGWNMQRSLKFRQIGRNPWVALVWDSTDSVIGIEVRGEATQRTQQDVEDPRRQAYIEVSPTKVFSWGINEDFVESFHQKMGYEMDHPARGRR